MTSATENQEFDYDKYRETHFEYWEMLGNASKSIRIDACLTCGELIKLFHELMEVTR